jgi:hypothetical protein
MMVGSRFEDLNDDERRKWQQVFEDDRRQRQPGTDSIERGNDEIGT